MIFKSKGQQHLDGHKELSKHSKIITINPKAGTKVYFPTITPNNKPFNVLVKPGDKVKLGQKIAERTDMYVPIYSSVSGTVLEQEDVFSTNANRPIKHITIESDGLDTRAELLKTVNFDSTQEEIIAAIKEAGLVGMGGAGFPTYIKYANPKGIDTLLVNAVECEPFITTDYVSAQRQANKLADGIRLLLKASGAKQCVVAIKVHKEEARDAIIKATSSYPEVVVKEVPDAYPMGWEKHLIKTALHRSYEKLPAECGVVISNIQTVISLGQVLLSGKIVYNRLITISGDAIKNPTNVLCRIGTQAKEIIAAAGGVTADEVTLIPGGPMCGKSVSNDNFPILMQMGALTILKYHAFEKDTCLRCGTCTDHCPNGLQPVEIVRAYKAKDYDRLNKLDTMACVSCGLCSYLCPSKIELADTINSAKTVLRFRAAAAQKK